MPARKTFTISSQKFFLVKQQATTPTPGGQARGTPPPPPDGPGRQRTRRPPPTSTNGHPASQSQPRQSRWSRRVTPRHARPHTPGHTWSRLVPPDHSPAGHAPSLTRSRAVSPGHTHPWHRCFATDSCCVHRSRAARSGVRDTMRERQCGASSVHCERPEAQPQRSKPKWAF